MGLASEMKNLSEELLASFKQRIIENEELVSEVQKTLDGFRKDHQEMTAVLNANAMALRKDLAAGEKTRISSFNELMSNIHHTIASIQTEVIEIQASTFNMINEFVVERTQMAGELNDFFAAGRADRAEDERIRIDEFNGLMKNINDDIKSINNEVAVIFKNTNAMLENFEKEHAEMSAELRAELGKNLAERIEYTQTLLNGFQKRLSEIGKENQKMAQALRKDLAEGETSRLGNYKRLMNAIHDSIKEVQKEVKDIEKTSAEMVWGYASERTQGAAEWNKMQDTIAQLRKTGVVKPAKAEKKKQTVSEPAVEAAKKGEIRQEPAKVATPVTPPVEAKPVKDSLTKEEPLQIETVVDLAKETQVAAPQKVKLKAEVPMTLEEKVLDYINNHPMGVKISEMEQPLGETRMKLGFTAKALLDEGRVQKMDNVYFPVKQ